ncbi:MAG: GNAT family N-acetyltransferase [Clostridia bacterium]|nr:GNAT family N-acetyltransferase [Clostridia bacterium]
MLEYKWFPAGVIDDSFRNLRIEIFVKEQGVPEENEFDDYDLQVPHLVIFSDSEPVATGRVIPYGEDTVKIGRIAVKKDKRGLGLGEKIVLELLRKSKEDGAKTVRVGAQTHAVGFYEKCGFSLLGTPEYMEENIPHYDMILNF